MRVLDSIRPVVVSIDGFGQIRGCWGGLGGFLDHDLDDLIGSNVLDLVAPSGRDEVASYFMSQLGDTVNSTVLPLPFRVKVLDAHGVEQSVDVIPTGLLDDPDEPGWVVVLVPLSLQAGASLPLDAEMAGASRNEVKRLLAAELDVDNREWVSRLYLVDLVGAQPVVLGSARSDEFVRRSIQSSIRSGWRPWTSIGSGIGEFDVPWAAVPPETEQELGIGGWNLLESAAISLDGAVVAGLVRVSRAASTAPLSTNRINVAARFRQLVDVAELLYRRWRDQDQLVAAAHTDTLTGLANREAVHAALDLGERSTSVLYIDIDRFKSVNDGWSHGVGDRVLIEVARRIEAACRPNDVVARFGGDEFVVLLRHVDDAAARRIGDRIVAEVSAPLDLVDGPQSVSVSVGLAPSNGTNNPLDLADRAMLSAKRLGRGRLVSV